MDKVCSTQNDLALNHGKCLPNADGKPTWYVFESDVSERRRVLYTPVVHKMIGGL